METTLPKTKARLQWTSLIQNNSLVHSDESMFLRSVYFFTVLVFAVFFFLQCFGSWFCQTVSKITCCISMINLIAGMPVVFSQCCRSVAKVPILLQSICMLVLCFWETLGCSAKHCRDGFHQTFLSVGVILFQKEKDIRKDTLTALFHVRRIKWFCTFKLGSYFIEVCHCYRIVIIGHDDVIMS